MEFRVLGPIEVIDEGRVVPLNAAKPRALLAMLLLRANEFVPSDRLIDDLWDAAPPATAPKILQKYVSQLRKALGHEAIETGPAGYRLRLDPEGLDLLRFRRLAADGNGSEPEQVASTLREALALWRGEPLAEFSSQQWARAETVRLDDLRLDVLERRIDADLAAGRDRELIDELERLVAAHPLRERARGQLMLALYRCDRQGDALAAYRTARETSVRSLGLEPGPSLRDLERAILHQDPSLDCTTPRAPAHHARPPGLPTRPTSFIGRAHEMGDVRERLRAGDARCLTLTGPPGTGKTRLALEAAAGLDETFPDGVVFVELAPLREPGLVLATIARALGVREDPERQLAEIVASVLRDRRHLLVLDNFEQLLAAAPLLSALLADAGATRALVTSRAPLDIPEERIYAVPPLALPDMSRPSHVAALNEIEAVQLFVDRAQQARPDFALSDENVAAIAELCVRLDGLPLALELAAARVKLLTPSAILARLDGRLRLLKAVPGAGLPERHRTLRAAVDWSYELLPTDEQALFTSLGVFVGGFSLEGAAGVAGDLDMDVDDGLESLLNSSLLRVEPMFGGEPRFGMLETMREYALERLAERGDDDAVRRRHANVFLRLAEQAEPALLGPEQLRWLQQLDRERGNLRSALSWSAESGEAEIGLRIAAALWRFWQMRAADAEGRDHLERLLASEAGSRSSRALGQSRAASLALYQGDFGAVRRYIDASLPVHRELGDDWNVSSGLQLLTMTFLAEGDADRAFAAAEEALDVARRTKSATIEAYALANMGIVRAVQGQLDVAQHLIEQSLRSGRESGNLRSVANWTKALGGVAVMQTDYPRAGALFEESLAIYRTLDDPWGTLGSLTGLSLVALERHDDGTARHLLVETLELLRKSGHHFRVANSLEIAARLATAQARHGSAARMYAAANGFRGSMAVGMFECEAWPDPAPTIAELRSVLGECEFAAAWAEGMTMTFDESIAHALEIATAPP